MLSEVTLIMEKRAVLPGRRKDETSTKCQVYFQRDPYCRKTCLHEVMRTCPDQAQHADTIKSPKSHNHKP